MRVIRLAAIVLAMLVSAWSVAGVRQAHDTTQAQAILSRSHPLGAGEARQVASLLNTAAVLNPDEEVQVLRGRLALAQGNKVRALPILLAVTRAEPRSREAWLWLAQAAIGQNAVLFGRALQTVLALDPPPPRNR